MEKIGFRLSQEYRRTKPFDSLGSLRTKKKHEARGTKTVAVTFSDCHLCGIKNRFSVIGSGFWETLKTIFTKTGHRVLEFLREPSTENRSPVFNNAVAVGRRVIPTYDARSRLYIKNRFSVIGSGFWETLKTIFTKTGHRVLDFLREPSTENRSPVFNNAVAVGRRVIPTYGARSRLYRYIKELGIEYRVLSIELRAKIGKVIKTLSSLISLIQYSRHNTQYIYDPFLKLWSVDYRLWTVFIGGISRRCGINSRTPRRFGAITYVRALQALHKLSAY